MSTYEDTVQTVLEENVVLMATTIRWWRGQYQIPRETVQMQAGGSPVDAKDVTIPRVKLITDDYPRDADGVPWKQRFQRLESRLNGVKERYSVPFPISAVRLIPKQRVAEYLEEIYGLTMGRLREEVAVATDEDTRRYWQEKLRRAETVVGTAAADATLVHDSERTQQSVAYELQQAADEFCQNWPEIRQQIWQQNPLAQYVHHRVPLTSEQMRKKFSLDVTPVELAGTAETTQFSGLEMLQQFGPLVREACRRRVEEAVEEMIRGPREQLARALAALSDLVARDGRVTSRSFRGVRAAIEKVRMFEFVTNAELLQKMQQMEELLERTDPRSLDSVTAANNGFQAALNNFMKNVADEVAIAEDLERFGNVRQLDILPTV